MTLYTPDSNTLYGFQNYRTGTWLALDSNHAFTQGQSFYGWEFLPTQAGAQQFLMRPYINRLYCVEPQSGAEGGVGICSSSTTQWSILALNDTTYNGYVQMFGTYDGATVSISFATGPTEDRGLYVWSLHENGEINDESWSVIPYLVAATSNSAVPAPTISLTSAPTSSSPTPTATTNNIPASTATTAASSEITAAPTLNPTVTDSSSSFTFSVSDKNLPSAIASIVLPSDTNFGCELCEGSGNYALTVGGYTTEDDEAETVLNFLENGYIDINVSQMVATLSMDLQLLPGFQPISTYFVVVGGVVTRRISKSVTLTGTFKMGIPLNVTLDSAVTLNGGVTVDIPGDINIHVVPSSISESSISGFSNANVSALPFKVNAPNLAFDIATGVRIQVGLTIDAELEEHVSASGSITVTADLPRLDAAFQALSNVNSQCQSPASGDTVHQQAVLVTPTSDFEVSADGDIELALSLADLETTTTLFATQFPSYSTSSSFPTQCLYDNKLQASFLNAGPSRRANLLGKGWLFAIYVAAACLWML